MEFDAPLSNIAHSLAALAFRRWYRSPSAAIPAVLVSLAAASVFFLLPAQKLAMMQLAFKLVLPMTMLILHGSFGGGDFLAERNLAFLLQERGQMKRWFLAFTSVHVAIGTVLILPMLIAGRLIEPQHAWIRIALVLELTNVLFILAAFAFALLLLQTRSEVARNLVLVLAYFGSSSLFAVSVIVLCFLATDINRLLDSVIAVAAAGAAMLLFPIMSRAGKIPRHKHPQQMQHPA